MDVRRARRGIAQRERILAGLLRICVQLERLQTTEPSRRACREVAAMLRALLWNQRRQGP